MRELFRVSVHLLGYLVVGLAVAQSVVGPLTGGQAVGVVLALIYARFVFFWNVKELRADVERKVSHEASCPTQ